MSASSKPIDFLWFIPTSGDGAYLGSGELTRAPDIGYMTQIAQAADRLGYSGVLLPTGVACEESFVTAAALSAKTEKLRFLVAIRPGTASPAYYARLTTTLDRISNGRVLLNIVVGGSPGELAGDGIHLEHDERYAHADEFFTVWEELLEKGVASFDRKYIKATNAQLGFPAPFQTPRPPLYFGGSSDAGIDFSVPMFRSTSLPGRAARTGRRKDRARAHRRGQERP
ncbi:LLM class flavin-dependent oxidoreductase [Rhizobium yanglingense]